MVVVSVTLAMFHYFSLCSRRTSFATLVARARRLVPEPPERSITAEEGTRLIRDVQRGLRLARVFDYRTRPDCLPRALASFVVLQRGGLRATLRIGARKFPFAAHAWVIVNDIAVSDPEAEWMKYQPLLTIP